MSFDYSRKEDVIKAISEKAEVSQVVANNVLNAFQEVVRDSLKEGNPVRLIGFGSFYATERAARKGRNPQTGEEIQIPAGKNYGFRMSKAFRDKI